jgi:hypothetical protein
MGFLYIIEISLLRGVTMTTTVLKIRLDYVKNRLSASFTCIAVNLFLSEILLYGEKAN